MWSGRRTFSFHASLETLAEAAVLALVAVVLIDGTVARGAARVGQTSTHRPLEKALAALARVLAVVLAGALVAADHALRRCCLHYLLMMLMMVVMSARGLGSDAPVWNAQAAL